MSDMIRALGNHDAALSNLVRLGCIAEVDGATARVQIGEITTDFLPFVVRRAAADAEWWQPSVGEQVVVASLWGDPSQGVILGAITQEAYPTAAEGAQWGKRFRDGTHLTYDPDAHVLTIEAEQAPVIVNCNSVSLTCQNATLTSKTVTVTSQAVTLDVPTISCTGSLTTAGDVVAGGISLMNHMHSDVQPGKGKTGKPG